MTFMITPAERMKILAGRDFDSIQRSAGTGCGPNGRIAAGSNGMGFHPR
ncbi:MAG: hypothetical protein U0164_08925 [Gemmatimonadaceae bacterium]